MLNYPSAVTLYLFIDETLFLCLAELFLCIFKMRSDGDVNGFLRGLDPHIDDLETFLREIRASSSCNDILRKNGKTMTHSGFDKSTHS